MVEQDMMIKEMSPQRAAVLAVLQKTARPMQPIEIAAATGMKYGNVAMMLLRMRTDGRASRARSLWTLAIDCAPRKVRRHALNIFNNLRWVTAHDGAFSHIGPMCVCAR